MGRMEELVQQLNTLNRHYYTLDEPLVSDIKYDELYEELQKLERKEGRILPDSPTQRVGGEILSKFEKHRHIQPLYSLDKSRSLEEIKAWIHRTNRWIESYNGTTEEKLPDPEYIVEYKFDGLTINLTYNEGKLIMAATRGNGVIGEDITAQVKTIESIPLTIPWTGLIEVQGEGLMPLSALKKYNERATEVLKNARNAAAGALRNLDPKETRKRHLTGYFYHVGTGGDGITSQIDALNFIERQGIPVFPYHVHCKTAEDLNREIEYIDEHRHGLDILTDGVVVKINDYRTREILGYTNKFPRWAIAYKFEAEETDTVLKAVEWNVGRTGKITPTGVVEEVELAGATIRRATLNNYDDILRKNLSLGARVLIRRSNEVIPEILGALPGEEKTVPIEKPKYCPACHTELIQDGVHLFCPNSLSCEPQLVSRMVHYASREAMDIEGLSDKTVQKLVKDMNLHRIPDLYRLTKEDLLTMEGFKDKKAENLLEAIEKSKHRSLSAFLNALGIPGVGVRTADILAERYGTMEDLAQAESEELQEIPDIGPVTGEAIYEFFHDPMIQASLDELKGFGITLKKEGKTGALTGLRIVITGSFEKYKRSELEKMFTLQGAVVSSSISAKTDLLFAGEKAGSKLEKAQALGVKVIEGDYLLEQYLKENLR